MKINIEVFNMLNSIAKLHNISDVEWAEASQIRRPTISELRRINRAAHKTGQDSGIRRACTLEKIIRLYAGLRIKVGSAILNEALRNCIETESNQDIRLLLLILILQSAKDENKDEAEAMLKVLIN
jgi:hypothetical protein